MTDWIETYRGTVHRWEVDNVDHFTVAYYFERLSDASLCFLHRLGLGPDYVRREHRGCLTIDCYVRYQQELRVADILHIATGVIAVDEGGLTLGHKLFNSGTGALCTTFEQRLGHVSLGDRKPLPLPAAARRAAEAASIEWDGPPRERRPRPAGVEGFVEAQRDTVKPWEIDVMGQSSLAHHVHRFTAANGHVLGAFGLTPGYQRDERRGFSTFEFQFEQTGTLRPGDLVRVRTGLLHVGNSSMRVLHRMFNDVTGDLVASLEQFGVLLDTEARRPTPLPAELRDRAHKLLVRS